MFRRRNRFCQRKGGLNHGAGRSRAQQLRNFPSRNRDAIHFKSPFGGDTAISGKLRDGKLPSVEAAVSAARFENVRNGPRRDKERRSPDRRFKQSAAKTPPSPQCVSSASVESTV